MVLDTEVYKNRLTEARDRINGELQTLGVHNKSNAQDWIATPESEVNAEPDPNDAADRVEEWDEHAATLAQLEREYNNITRALAKIENGTYGTCEISNEEIEADRLDANPAARTCKMHIDDDATLPE